MCKGVGLMLAALVLSVGPYALGESRVEGTEGTADPALGAVAPRLDQTSAADPCAEPGLQPNSMSPTWNIQALPVQCGALETDNMALLQPLGNGVQQWILATTAKYGLSPRFQLRWGLPGRISQHASGARPVTGTTDQAIGVLFHFRKQAGSMPDMSVDYGFKIPTANPSKSFGSGYADHVITLIASRDRGSCHFDSNLAATFAGGPQGMDRAVQSGVGASRTFPHQLMATVEAFGGSQPGIADRYGAVSLAGAWGARPWLALNGAWIRSYTASSPRTQIVFGFMYTVRPGIRLRGMR